MNNTFVVQTYSIYQMKLFFAVLIALSALSAIAQSSGRYSNNTVFHINTSNPFYSATVGGLAVQSITESNDSCEVFFLNTVDLTKVMVGSSVTLSSTVNDAGGTNDGKYQITAKTDTSLSFSSPFVSVQSNPGGGAYIDPFPVATRLYVIGDSTTIASVQMQKSYGLPTSLDNIILSPGMTIWGLFETVILSKGQAILYFE